jgi:ABC-type Zn uptake system ZnuABC Zn-binding protein ZnuA
MTHYFSMKYVWLLILVLGFSIIVSACGSLSSQDADPHEGERPGFLTDAADFTPVDLSEGEKLRVVATTSIVADVVAEIGDTAIELTILMPANVDPHAYEPTPADLRTVSDAHVVIINGLGLEEFLEAMLENLNPEVSILSLSEGLEALTFEEDEHSEEAHSEEAGEDHAHSGLDPHVWFDPTNVMIWADRTAQAFSQMDPDNAGLFGRNAQAYQEQLRELDQWIFTSVSTLSAENRKIVSDHRVFEYFAARYDFEVIGAVIPVFSSAAEPSAREIADLHQVIKDFGVKVIFVGEYISPDIVEAIASDTGAQLVRLYTGSLSGGNGPAGNYLDFMRYNVATIVNALSAQDVP